MTSPWRMKQEPSCEEKRQSRMHLACTSSWCHICLFAHIFTKIPKIWSNMHLLYPFAILCKWQTLRLGSGAEPRKVEAHTVKRLHTHITYININGALRTEKILVSQTITEIVFLVASWHLLYQGPADWRLTPTESHFIPLRWGGRCDMCFRTKPGIETIGCIATSLLVQRMRSDTKWCKKSQRLGFDSEPKKISIQ